MKKNSYSNLFSFFTGYTKGLVAIISKMSNEESGTYQFTLGFPAEKQDIQIKDNIQIDGVLAVVTDVSDHDFTVSTTTELITGSTLADVSVGDKVSLGLNAMVEPEQNRSYLIEASCSKTVKLVSSHVQPGHEHTWQLNFTADEELPYIENDKHFGLAGSSMTARYVKHANHLTTFSIFCGRVSRETSIFNESMKIGTCINITEPKRL